MKIEDLTLKQIKDFCKKKPVCFNCELEFFCLDALKNSVCAPCNWDEEHLEQEVDI